MSTKRRRRNVEVAPEQECNVLPPHVLLFAPVDLETGGKFLRQLEGFLSHHKDGKVVLGSFRLPEDQVLTTPN